MKIQTLAVGLLLATGANAASAYECQYSEKLSLDLDAGSAESFTVDAGAGSLSIRGVDGSGAVRIEGTACASDADDLEQMRLEDESRGDRLAVRTEIPETSGGWFGGRSYARIDLVIEVPTSLSLRIDDGSGSIELENVGNTWIEDGSGEIHVRDVFGDLEIDDGSGEIDVVNVTGNVTVEDGSGEIEIEGVQGFVTIIDDGSGEIEIANVQRDVSIGDDGSGSIVIEDVIGNVIIDSDGSGSIEVRNIGGNFEVGRDGSGGVRYTRVDGDVRVPGERYK
ncbi:MAG: hypothetical protein R3200_13920 [Xanthomonadales bacterium]|nr:hypothetical protein [Xanthomonadales bacterium]